jgi:hypothetical protein
MARHSSAEKGIVILEPPIQGHDFSNTFPLFRKMFYSTISYHGRHEAAKSAMNGEVQSG